MTDETPDAIPTELSRLFHLAEFADSPEHEVEIEATAAECQALAKRYELLSLEALAARMTVRQNPLGEITVEGRLTAKLTQECVVTLEPVDDVIDAPFDQRYTLNPAEPEDELEIGPEDIEPPEPVTGDSIDLGELVAQYLYLSINPYPRAPDADVEIAEIKTKTQDNGPFAALAQLRDRDRN
ncbi:MAG: DUF177 domain-containing protein [Alphaproteobacteria bacterium]|nr:DUF177 domain-containing protein [Alphaproteobacteria bacterium]